MFLSPAEIKQQQLREKRGAYEREDVDGLIDNVVGSYQHVWLERDRLQARVEELEKEMANTKELEQLLRDGLASAQRAAEQVKEEAEQQVSGLVEKAKQEAEALLADARAKAEEIVAGSRDTRDRLEEETTRLERANHDVRERYMAFLREALAVVEGTAEQKAVTPQEAGVADAEDAAPADEEEELEAPVGWLATVPLMAVASDEVAETIERPEPEAVEDEPEAEPEPAASSRRTRTCPPPCCCRPSHRLRRRKPPRSPSPSPRQPTTTRPPTSSCWVRCGSPSPSPSPSPKRKRSPSRSPRRRPPRRKRRRRRRKRSPTRRT